MRQQRWRRKPPTCVKESFKINDRRAPALRNPIPPPWCTPSSAAWYWPNSLKESPGCIITPRAEHTADHNNQYGQAKKPRRRERRAVWFLAEFCCFFFFVFVVGTPTWTFGVCACVVQVFVVFRIYFFFTCFWWLWLRLNLGAIRYPGARLFAYTHPQNEALGLHNRKVTNGFRGDTKIYIFSGGLESSLGNIEG